MGKRNPSTGHSIQLVLRGRTLRDIIERPTTLKVNCENCIRSTTWSPAQARNEIKFRAFMDLPIERLAEQLFCAACRSRNFFLTIQVRRNPLLPPA